MSEDPLREEIAKRMEKVRKDIPVEKKPNWRRRVIVLVMTLVLAGIMLFSILRYFW
ncbi:MAG: hypothetical protein K2L20_02155 [Ligilactobacillus sp.]|nr:hypothetical protein [Ligilactobacillus sp.]